MTKNILSIKEYLDRKEKLLIDYSTKEGDRIAFDLMDYEPKGTDNTGILFAIWTTILTQLILRGWKPTELMKEIKYYNQVAQDIKKEHRD
jgi:hypothetical protein